MAVRISMKEYDAWLLDLEKIHRSLNTWYGFAVGFIGERKSLLEAKEGIDKLRKLIDFLERLKVQIFSQITHCTNCGALNPMPNHVCPRYTSSD